MNDNWRKAEELAARTYNLQFIRDWDSGKSYYLQKSWRCRVVTATERQLRKRDRTAVINRREPPKPIEVKIDAVTPKLV